jgi:hypothetical protein
MDESRVTRALTGSSVEVDVEKRYNLLFIFLLIQKEANLYLAQVNLLLRSINRKAQRRTRKQKGNFNYW